MAAAPPDNWRDGGLSPMIGPLDARAVFPWLFFIMNMALWTMIVCVLATAVFGVLSRLGYDPKIAWGRFQDWLLNGQIQAGRLARFAPATRLDLRPAPWETQ